jgi:hypothetical protein
VQIFISDTTNALLTGGFGVLLYAFLFLKEKKHQELDLANAVIVFLAWASLIGGFRVLFLSFNKSICNPTEIEQVYIFIGGLAVVWTSLMELYKKYSTI